jgi:hypothetical protein
MNDGCACRVRIVAGGPDRGSRLVLKANTIFSGVNLSEKKMRASLAVSLVVFLSTGHGFSAVFARDESMTGMRVECGSSPQDLTEVRGSF